MPEKGSSEGYVFFNKQRKRWNAQYSSYDTQTGKITKKTKSFKIGIIQIPITIIIIQNHHFL